MAKSNIVLCGFMGCGKTTVGFQLARRLYYRYVDMDRYIEEREGRSIKEIFAKDGEPAFRRIEEETSAELGGRGNQVIASGGGTLINPKNAEAFHKSGVIVLIDVPFDVIYERLLRSQDRPIVNNSTKEELFELYTRRMPIYRAAADYTVSGDTLVENVVEDIKAKLESEGCL